MVKQVISLTDVVNKPLNAVESTILLGWHKLATDQEKVAQIEFWFSSVQQLWPSVVRFSLHDPIFDNFCHRVELQPLWWDIWAGFGVSLLEHQQKPIFFMPQLDFHPLDLCIGAHFFGLSVKAKRTIGIDYSETELAFLRYAIEHYPSIHAVQRYNAYLYQQLQPMAAKWCNAINVAEQAESTFTAARDNCLALLPQGKYVLGDNLGYGSYAYMLLTEVYVRWLPYVGVDTDNLLSTIQGCMQHAIGVESRSQVAITNASFGAGIRLADPQGVELIGLVAIQHYINSQLTNEQRTKAISRGHAVTANAGHWQQPRGSRDNKREESKPAPADSPLVNSSKITPP